jgi:hypothetical protein
MPQSPADRQRRYGLQLKVSRRVRVSSVMLLHGASHSRPSASV